MNNDRFGYIVSFLNDKILLIRIFDESFSKETAPLVLKLLQNQYQKRNGHARITRK